MFVKRILLYCDGNHPKCEVQGSEASEGDATHKTVAEYKEEMRKNGWVFRQGNKAYCPICKQALKDKE